MGATIFSNYPIRTEKVLTFPTQYGMIMVYNFLPFFSILHARAVHAVKLPLPTRLCQPKLG